MKKLFRWLFAMQILATIILCICSIVAKETALTIIQYLIIGLFNCFLLYGILALYEWRDKSSQSNTNREIILLKKEIEELKNILIDKNILGCEYLTDDNESILEEKEKAVLFKIFDQVAEICSTFNIEQATLISKFKIPKVINSFYLKISILGQLNKEEEINLLSKIKEINKFNKIDLLFVEKVDEDFEEIIYNKNTYST